jgi:hypothetical protein
VTSAEYLQRLGVALPVPALLGDVLSALASDPRVLSRLDKSFHEPLQALIGAGSLSTRILKSTSTSEGREGVRKVYGRLCECLAQNRLFTP